MQHVAMRLDSDQGIVIGTDGRFLAVPWSVAQQHGATDDVSSADTPALVKSLLDAAIFAGRSISEAGRSKPAQPSLSALQWVMNLISSYQTTRCIPRTFLIAAARLHACGDYKGVDFVLQKYSEESWHYKLALSDIAALGFDAEHLVESISIKSADIVCDYALTLANEGEPVSAIGVAYVGERASLDVGQAYIDRIDALFATEINATRCLRVHSAVGSDPDHVDDIVDFTFKASPADRRAIVEAVFRASKVFFEFPWHRQSDLEFLALCKANGVRVPSSFLTEHMPLRNAA